MRALAYPLHDSRGARSVAMPTLQEQFPGFMTVATIMAATLGILWLFGA